MVSGVKGVSYECLPNHTVAPSEHISSLLICLQTILLSLWHIWSTQQTPCSEGNITAGRESLLTLSRFSLCLPQSWQTLVCFKAYFVLCCQTAGFIQSSTIPPGIWLLIKQHNSNYQHSALCANFTNRPTSEKLLDIKQSRRLDQEHPHIPLLSLHELSEHYTPYYEQSHISWQHVSYAAPPEASHVSKPFLK